MSYYYPSALLQEAMSLLVCKSFQTRYDDLQEYLGMTLSDDNYEFSRPVLPKFETLWKRYCECFDYEQTHDKIEWLDGELNGLSHAIEHFSEFENEWGLYKYVIKRFRTWRKRSIVIA